MSVLLQGGSKEQPALHELYEMGGGQQLYHGLMGCPQRAKIGCGSNVRVCRENSPQVPATVVSEHVCDNRDGERAVGGQ